jgi:hypothetical protein
VNRSVPAPVALPTLNALERLDARVVASSSALDSEDYFHRADPSGAARR